MERFILNQLIVDSGKDEQGRPILSVNCCNFPDPDVTNYDEVLELSLKRLNRIVANEYVLVVFTSPMEYSPSLSWMLEAYKSLSRDYKKNIKQLIIVHPSWWFRLIVAFMQNIVSSKFAKKIVNVDSIEELESILKTDEMNIPAAVRVYDNEENGEVFEEAELEKARTIMEGDRKPKVFKTPLEESCPDSDYPEEIKNLMEYLTNKGLKSDGIFRRSPNQESLNIIIDRMNLHEPINFDEFDIYTLASVLKEFIRGLPDTLIPESSYPLLSDTSILTKNDDEMIPYIYSNFISPLDDRSRKLLKDLMMMSAMTAQLSKSNRMSSRALAVVWAPNMVRMDTRKDELKIIMAVIKIVECMIDNYDEVFCNRSKFLDL